MSVEFRVSLVMLFLHSIVAAVISILFLPSVRAWGFPYGSQKVRGVNLGGWLLLEVGWRSVTSKPMINAVTAVDNTIHL